MSRFSLRALGAWLRRGRAPAVEPTVFPRLPDGVAERFSFVTSAYDTRPEFLRELAATIRAQDAPGASWILVDNGSKSAATRACIDELGRAPRTKVVRVADNRGILGGMRCALEAATTDFVLPVDSDDLLAPHAITAMGHAVLGDSDARFLFSDEDHFTDGKRCNPFYRTGWDPALALASSYIWHLCAFDRREALRLGVYADPGANYCHDWDTLLRFVRAGHRPRHVREILYSWRTHASSTTNNAADAHAGSLASQRHVLDLHLRETGLADRFVVADCPLWRGAPELRLERTSANLPAIDLVIVGHDEIDGPRADAIAAALGASAPIRGRHVWSERDDAAGGNSFAALLGRIATDAPFAVLFVDADANVREPDAAHELVSWLELLDDCAIVGGRLLDENGRVLSAGDHPASRAILASPDEGRATDDAGHFAMALKPRCSAAVRGGCMMTRGSWLATASEALATQPVRIATLGPWLSAVAAATGRRAVCTPFVTADRGLARIPSGLAASALQRLAGDEWIASKAQSVWYGANRAP